MSFRLPRKCANGCGHQLYLTMSLSINNRDKGEWTDVFIGYHDYQKWWGEEGESAVNIK